MKNAFLLLFVLCLLAACDKDEEPTTQTIETSPIYYRFPGQIGSNDNSTILSIDGNLISCLNTENGISILNISKIGAYIWRKDFNGGVNGNASGITQTSDGSLFICGETSRNHATTGTQLDILVVKTTAEGDTIWTKTYGGTEKDYGTNVIATSDGNLLVSGDTESFGAGSYGDIYLLKINLDGDTLWTRSYPNLDQEIPYHLLETQNGDYLVTGVDQGAVPSQVYLLKVRADGTKVWEKKIGNEGWRWGYSTIELSNGDLLTCGDYIGGNLEYAQVLLIKTNRFGNVIWEKTFGQPKVQEWGYSIKQNMDDTFTITGFSVDIYESYQLPGMPVGFTSSQYDIILLKVHANGNQLWMRDFGGAEFVDKGYNLLKDSNDDNIITGNYGETFFMTRTDADGNFK